MTRAPTELAQEASAEQETAARVSRDGERRIFTTEEDTPDHLAYRRRTALRRHNARMGTPLHRLVHGFFVSVVAAPLLMLVVRTLFRCERRGAERLQAALPRGAIFAGRHYYEWDPFVSGVLALWPAMLRYPLLNPLHAAGSFWSRTRLRRLASYLFGIVGLHRGSRARQSAFDRFVELSRRGPVTIAIFPTGPIGERETYSLGPGVAVLALQCPDVPIVPVSLLGIAGLRWRDVLLLRRPPLTVSIGEPFHARDVQGGTDHERISRICRRIADQWSIEENAALDRHPEGAGSVREEDATPPVALG